MSFDIDIRLRRGGKDIALRLVSESRLVALFGPSGSGKTSALSAVAGLLQPLSGRIAIAGRLLFDSETGVNVPVEQRGCGYVFQDVRLFPHMTVRQNIAFGQPRAQGSRPWMTLPEMAEFLGIQPLLDRSPANLSGGEAQRVAIARTLMSGPDFLLLDEPLSSVDWRRRDEIMTIIERLRDEFQIPMLFVSHERTEVDRLSQHVIEMA